MEELCRYCDNPLDQETRTVTHSYWNAFPFVCHKACKESGYKQEAIDCQIIDADCNDCKHFKRGQLISKEIWTGHCLKFDSETRAYPNKWTGHECFEHRRQSR